MASPAPPARSVRLLRRLAVAVMGSLVVVVGLVLVPLPGPGWAIVFAGVALLGTEFSWAERLLRVLRHRLAPAAAVLQRLPRALRSVVLMTAAAGAVGALTLSLVLLSR